MNYGQVAHLLERPLSARAVGWAMHGCPDNVPWHRVVSASGECSADRIDGAEPGRQRRRLAREGVGFTAAGHVDMERFRWLPDREP